MRPKLTEEQRAHLQSALRKPPKVAGFNLDAWNVPTIQEFIERHFQQRYQEESIKSMLSTMRIRLAPKSQLDPSQIQQVRKALADTPQLVGLEAPYWTIPLAVHWINENFGATYKESTIKKFIESYCVKFYSLHEHNRRVDPLVVARLVAEGFTIKQIAEHYEVTPHIIKKAM